VTDFTNNADGDVVPVGDDSWQLEDNLDVMLADRNPLQYRVHQRRPNA
jgi:hypothetical protein